MLHYVLLLGCNAYESAPKPRRTSVPEVIDMLTSGSSLPTKHIINSPLLRTICRHNLGHPRSYIIISMTLQRYQEKKPTFEFHLYHVFRIRKLKDNIIHSTRSVRNLCPRPVHQNCLTQAQLGSYGILSSLVLYCAIYSCPNLEIGKSRNPWVRKFFENISLENRLVRINI